MKNAILTLLTALSVLLSAATSLAQPVRGTVQGLVLDPTGGVVAGAQVILTNEATAARLSVRTDDRGWFVITPVDPGPFSYSPDGSKVYVALDGGDAVNATRALQVVTTQTGVVTTKPLGSAPSSVGILPGAAQAFTAQRHPLGRVSFVDLASDAVRTVTGFDLNSQVVQ